MTLKEYLKNQILDTGPLSVKDYMDLCLNHPTYGYYKTRDPLGQAGDFITAPEISQLFGEMIGLWVLDAWEKLGSPLPIHIIEMGPGRGTLMYDMVRVWNLRPVLLKGLQIHLLESNPLLREVQHRTLQNLPVTWHSTLESLKDALGQEPQFWIANEFFDALPIQQFIWTADGWRERCVEFQKGDFDFGTREISSQGRLPSGKGLPYGTVYEVNPMMEDIGLYISQQIQKKGGGLLFVDYGEYEGWGDTLQAMGHHQKVPVFEGPGLCDLTAHVQFKPLQEIFSHAGIQTTFQTQSHFLRNMGIEYRAQQLLKKATSSQKAEILTGLLKLLGKETSEMQMGSLFKVLYGVRSL